jgi:hypothetical protein
MKAVFARLLFIAAILFSIPPLCFLVAGLTAPERFHAEREAEILASPARVWAVVTDWELLAAGMDKMMPRIGKRRVLGGPEPAAGRVVRWPLGDGRDWDQRIVAWDSPVRYAFRNDKGVSAGMPGDVAMAFELAPTPGGFTRVRFTVDIEADGFFNRSITHIFGVWVGTLRGYQVALLDVAKSAAESRVKN